MDFLPLRELRGCDRGFVAGAGSEDGPVRWGQPVARCTTTDSATRHSESSTGCPRPALARPPGMYIGKPPFAGPRQVLAYIANYTHRVALSERQIVAVNEPDGTVTFRWRDYAAKGEVKLCTLPADEFLHRFRRHLLPPGFTKVRHYGLLANNTRRRLIPQARQAIAAGSGKRRDKVGDNSATTTMNSDGVGCSSCGKFNVQCIALVLPSGRRIERRLPLVARVREPP